MGTEQQKLALLLDPRPEGHNPMSPSAFGRVSDRSRNGYGAVTERIRNGPFTRFWRAGPRSRPSFWTDSYCLAKEG